MGGDGGSISKRSDVVIKKQAPLKPGRDAVRTKFFFRTFFN